ncbi:tryptophan-rich sensory protein [Paenibacillus gansuensis]|uniref:Tryptophan-rich sensory protein n=1 Tax=Paenibacillus gansuensis TaxID=306542 RepID=A0ABW5PDL6_9BACL
MPFWSFAVFFITLALLQASRRLISENRAWIEQISRPSWDFTLPDSFYSKADLAAHVLASGGIAAIHYETDGFASVSFSWFVLVAVHYSLQQSLPYLVHSAGNLYWAFLDSFLITATASMLLALTGKYSMISVWLLAVYLLYCAFTTFRLWLIYHLNRE